MWTVSRIPAAPFVYRPATPAPRPYLRGTQYPHKNGGVCGEDMGGRGHIVLSNLNSGGSSSASDPKLQIRKQEENGKQLSGSDVLWALQRAAAKNKPKKKKKKKKQASSADTRREDKDDDDGTNVEVKPLCIRNEWAVKLDELDKRLQELSELT